MGYAQSYGSLGPGTYGNVYNSDRYGVRLHPDWYYTTKVRARWCYRYRSHVGKVQTIKYSTTTTIPSTWDENLMQMRFCGWQPGNPTIIPSIHDNRHESEWQWYYRHPVVNAVLPWGYGTYVRPWYGNTAKIIRFPDGQAVGIIRDCTDQLLRNQTFLIGDWEGQATLYNAYSD